MAYIQQQQHSYGTRPTNNFNNTFQNQFGQFVQRPNGMPQSQYPTPGFQQQRMGLQTSSSLPSQHFAQQFRPPISQPRARFNGPFPSAGYGGGSQTGFMPPVQPPQQLPQRPPMPSTALQENQRQKLIEQIQQWNSFRYDLFEISTPNEVC